jgi:hypothetical protein
MAPMTNTPTAGAASTPIPRSRWNHRNGAEYEVLMLTNIDSTDQIKYPTTVVYRSVANGKLWSRPVHDWWRSMTYIVGTPNITLEN